MTWEQRGSDWLHGARLRPTRQRLALATLLVGDGNDRHVTAENLHRACLAGPDAVSLATVYNTLRTFCAVGLMNEIPMGGNKSYFDTRVDDHPHFYWEESGELTDAPKDMLRFASLPDVPAGHELTKIDVVIRLRKTSKISS